MNCNYFINIYKLKEMSSLRDLLSRDLPNNNDGGVLGQEPKETLTQKFQNSNKTKPNPNSILRPGIRKFKRSDYKKAKLKNIGFPRKLTPTQNCKRKYSVAVEYQDEMGKAHVKNVRFGRDDVPDFIDHKDPKKRLSTVSKMGNDENFLHPNFYKMYLLNSRNSNIHDAYKDLIQVLEL